MTNPRVHETEDSITHGSLEWSDTFRDRLNFDRARLLTEAINAWRSNPLARRIIEITTEFALGDGFGFTAANGQVQAFLKRFWTHELNDLDTQLREWADEAWRTGDLFILFSLDEGGFPLVRAIPAENITAIQTAPNDTRQEIAFQRNALDNDPYPAYQPGAGQRSFVLHFALNRAVGASFGESDLASVLLWIKLHRQWLEDRARLNYYRQFFSFVVSKSFASDDEKKAFGRELESRRPRPGALLLTTPGETWSTLAPNLASAEAGEDGLALKRMIATGAGLPLHYLGEPEGSTRTTAEAAGTPAFKRFKSRQKFLENAVKRVLQVAMAVYRLNGGRLPAQPEFELTVPDVTERDNATLAIGVQRIVNAFAPLYNAKLIDRPELIRIVYRFLAEVPPEAEAGAFVPINTKAVAGKSLAPAAGEDPLRDGNG